MAIGIHLTTTIVIPGLEGDPVTLPEGINTLGDLLTDVGKRMHFDLIDASSGDLTDDLEIILNGKEIWFHPAGMNTRLQDGDTLEIHMVPLGGG